MRKENWVPRREEVKAKKIDEVRKDAELEEARRSSGGGSSRGDSRRSSGRGGMPSLAQQGIMRRTPSSGPLSKPKPEPADLSKIGTFQNKAPTKIFGPPSFKKVTTTTPTQNAFG